MDMRTIISLPNYDLVSIRMEALVLGKLVAQIFRYFELQGQFEVQLFAGPAPYEILKVLGSKGNRLFQTVPNEVSDEQHHVKKRTLAASVGTYENMEAVKGHIHIA